MRQPTASEKLVAARSLLDAARKVLSAYPNVLGVGVGLRTRQGAFTDEECFVVTVQKKRDLSARDMVPSSLFGVPVDVQESEEPRLLRSVAAAGNVKKSGSTVAGHIGLLARQADGSTCALTVLHALMEGSDDRSYPENAGGYFGVDAKMYYDPFFPIGRLVEGYFNEYVDIARVALRDVEPQAAFYGTTLKPGDPFDLRGVSLGLGVAMVVPGAATNITGKLVAYPVDVPMTIDGRAVTFRGLAKFAMEGAPLDEGCSGSALFLPDYGNRPVALLTCGTTRTAYGFNLARHWATWGLAPVDGANE